LIIVVVILLLGGGGGYYGYRRYGGAGLGGTPGLILPILLVLWFFSGMLRRARQRGFCNRLGSQRDRLANHRTEHKKQFGQTMKRSLPYRLERVLRG
jgi:hypothetical protein